METPDAGTPAGEATPASQPTGEIKEGGEAVKTGTEATPNDPPPKKDKGVGKRINELVRQREAARREAEQARREAEELRKTGKPEAEPKESDFGSYSEFLKAVARYELNQQLKTEREESEKKASQRERERYKAEVSEQFQERIAEFKEKTKDFDDVVEGSGILDIPASPTMEAMSLAISESDSGPQLLYHLAQNMKEAYRIARLSPFAAAREIGKLEAKLPELVKQTSSAPAPIAPVKPKSNASEEPSETDDMADWIKKRRKQLKR